MTLLSDIIKNTSAKTWVGLGVAAAIGTTAGVKRVVKRRKANLDDTELVKKVNDLFNTALGTSASVVATAREAGASVAENVREDIKTIVESVKSEKACVSRCSHCVIKDTFKPCCSDKKSCKAESEATTDETLPEPVKATDVADAHKESDALSETEKNEEPVEPNDDTTVRNLVKDTLRTSPESLLVGEVRDVEASDLAVETEKSEQPTEPVAEKEEPAKKTPTRKPAARKAPVAKKPATPRASRAKKVIPPVESAAPKTAAPEENKTEENKED